MPRRNLVITLIVAFSLAAIMLGSALIYGVFRIVSYGRKELEAKSVQVLYRTDHQALLDACDEMWKNRALYRPDPKWNNTTPGDTGYPDPADPKIPAIVRSLKPGYIVIEADYVNIALSSGHFHTGIYAFEQGSPPIPVTKELLPRLFYYSEDGQIPSKPKQ
jgi:hypothetical protein